MADSPVLDYYRATDHGCRLRRIGETFVEDTYAIGMIKGFPLKESISALIAKYSSNGYLDILSEKWYGGLPCFKFEADIVQPRSLGKVYLIVSIGCYERRTDERCTSVVMLVSCTLMHVNIAMNTARLLIVFV